jgi:hypothetical protein
MMHDVGKVAGQELRHGVTSIRSSVPESSAAALQADTDDTATTVSSPCLSLQDCSFLCEDYSSSFHLVCDLVATGRSCERRTKTAPATFAARHRRAPQLHTLALLYAPTQYAYNLRLRSNYSFVPSYRHLYLVAHSSINSPPSSAACTFDPSIPLQAPRRRPRQ